MIRFADADEPVRKVARPAVTPTLATKTGRVTEIQGAKKRGRPASGKALTPAQKQRALRERRKAKG
jgi:hypothetical protein